MAAMRSSQDPYGDGTQLVDQLIGDAYVTVKLVADNLAIIQRATDLLTDTIDVSFAALGQADVALGVRIDNVTTQINTEITDSGAADTVLQSNIDAETAARISGDSGLNDQIVAEVTARTTAITNLTLQINTETNSRIAADLSEATSRSAADVALGGRVDTEITNRITGDNALGTRIDNEVIARNAAIAAANVSALADMAVQVNLAAAQVALATTQANIATTAAASTNLKVQTNALTPTTPPAGSASGDSYWAVDSTYANLVLYNNTAGVGVQVTPVIKFSIISMMNLGNGPIEFSFTDNSGYRWFQVTPSDMKHAAVDALKTRASNLEAYAAKLPLNAYSGPAVIGLTDPTGNFWLKATPDSLQHKTLDKMQQSITVALNESIADPSVADMRNLAQIIHLFMSGESLSLGHGSGLVTTGASAYADMFGNAGLTKASIVPDDISDIASKTDPNLIANRAALTPAIETIYGADIDDWTSHGETPMSGCAQMIVQLLKDENGIDFTSSGMRFLLTDDGRNGGSIMTEDETNVGMTAQRVYASMSQGLALNTGLGRSYAPSAQLLMNGTNDNASETTYYPGGADTKWYYSRALTVQAQRQAYAQQLMGSSHFRLPFFLGQVATHTEAGFNAPYARVARDQLQLALDHPEFILACIQYAVEQGSPNNPHLTGRGTKLAGAYFGWHIKRLLFDGIRIEPMVPIVTAQGRFIKLTFPVRPRHKIVGGITGRDTTVLSDWGIKAYDAGGVQKVLTNPKVVNDNSVVLLAPEVPANNWRIECGLVGNTTKGWTNIGEMRSDGAYLFDPDFQRDPIYRWLPICVRYLS